MTTRDDTPFRFNTETQADNEGNPEGAHHVRSNRWLVPRRPVSAMGMFVDDIGADAPPARMRLSLQSGRPPRDRRSDVVAPDAATPDVIDLREPTASPEASDSERPTSATVDQAGSTWVDVRIPVKVSVVIPTLNEADNLRELLPTLPDGLHEVVIVDGHSTDGTRDVARELIPDVKIVNQSRKGKGNALAHGFDAVTGDIIAMIDADGSADPAELSLYITALLNGADFVKGSRYSAGGGSTDLTGIRSAGNFVLNQLVNLLYGTRFSDLCYGYNVFWRHCLPFIGLDELLESGPESPVWGDGFEVETLITTRVAKAGLRVVEVPSIEYDRIHGETHLRTFSDGTRVLRTALVERLQPPPPRAEFVTGATDSQQAATARQTVALVVVVSPGKDLEELSETLDSVGRQDRAPDEFLIVVDHDQEILAACQERFPHVRVVENARTKGLAGAWNTAIAVTSSQVIAMLDADATAEPQWLQQLMSELEAHPDVAIVGGRTLTVWPQGRPEWFPPEMDWAVGGTYRGMPRKVHDIRDPFGGNVAYRREVFINADFREGSNAAVETELALRHRQEHPSSKVIYVPDALIRRRIPQDRATWRQMISRCVDEGTAKATIANSTVGAHDATSRERGYIGRVLSRAVVEGLIESALTGKKAPATRSMAVVSGLGAAGAAYTRARVAAKVGRSSAAEGRPQNP